MIATIRRLDCCGKEIWRLTTAHGADKRLDLDTREEAEQIAEGLCRRANAWPLTIDILLTPDRIATTRRIPAPRDPALFTV